MPRVQLQARDRYPHRTAISVRTTDLNYGGHLGNDRLLCLIHEARVAFLAAAGFTELACGGVSLIMADAAISYRGEAFGGDDLVIESSADEFGRLGFRLFHRVTRPADGTMIALVETGMVCFDYEERRPVAVPGHVRSGLEDRPDAD